MSGPASVIGFRTPVGRRPYVIVGVALMLVKYGVEAATIGALTGRLYTPLDFVSCTGSISAS